MNQYNEFASIYDELINADIDYNAWANRILEICSRYNIERRDYLDLACGTGNMTMELSKYFRNTWAVDISDQMLTEAESKLRAFNNKAKFVCQDICRLKLNSKFDLVTCCLDSTNYILEDQELESYFKGVNFHLKDNGIFIFDINSYYKLTEVLGNNSYNFDSEDVVYIWDNILENDIVQMNLTFFVREGEFYRRFDEEHCERAYSEEYLKRLIENTGFKIIEKLNNYMDIPIEKDTERIVYILGKK